MKISECFHSVQGEGSQVGLNTVFLRLSGCDLGCQFCDSKYHWNGRNVEIIDIMSEILKHNTRNLTITGGEPLLQEGDIVKLIEMLPQKSQISIETNGTLIPCKFLLKQVKQWNVSPKLENSGNAFEKRFNYNALKVLNRKNSIFKFVITSKKDIKEVQSIQKKIKIPWERIYLMPEGVTHNQLNMRSRWIIEECKKLGCNFSPRIQIYIYGSKRGV